MPTTTHRRDEAGPTVTVGCGPISARSISPDSPLHGGCARQSALPQRAALLEPLKHKAAPRFQALKLQALCSQNREWKGMRVCRPPLPSASPWFPHWNCRPKGMAKWRKRPPASHTTAWSSRAERGRTEEHGKGACFQQKCCVSVRNQGLSGVPWQYGHRWHKKGVAKQLLIRETHRRTLMPALRKKKCNGLIMKL